MANPEFEVKLQGKHTFVIRVLDYILRQLASCFIAILISTIYLFVIFT